MAREKRRLAAVFIVGGPDGRFDGRGEQLAEVLDLEAIRRRRPARQSYAKGLLSSYELVED